MKERLSYFDGLRGLAALVVVFHHYDLAFLVVNHIAPGKIKHIVGMQPFSNVTNGNLAVCIFFILSGYVLSYPFFSNERTEYFISGATKRYFRLQIPILASILLSYMLLRLGAYHHFEVIPFSGSEWLPQYWNKGTFYPSALYDSLYTVMFSDDGYYNKPVLWTMKLEFYGSLMVFAFLAFFGTNRNRWIIYLALFILLKQNYYQGFLFGLILSDLTHKGIQFKYQEAVAFFFLVCSQVMVRLPRNVLEEMEKISTLNMVYALLLVLAVRFSPFIQKRCQSRPLKFLGDISFSIYLLHPLVLASVSSITFVGLLHSGHSYLISFWVSFALSMVVLFPTSYLFYLYVDKTGMRLANQLYIWFFKKEVKTNIDG